MPKSELTATSAAQVIFALKLTCILFGFLLIYLTYTVHPQSQSAADATVEFAITAIALVDIALGFFLPRYIVYLDRCAPQRRQQTTPIQQWMTFRVMSLAFIQSCNLFAFMLHLFGARSGIIFVLFTVGMCSLILWNPGKPPAEAEGAIRNG